MIGRPELNPVRFIKLSKYDYLVNFPVVDNLLSDTTFDNIQPIIQNQKWGVNQEITFQIACNDKSKVSAKVYLNGVETILTYTDLNPYAPFSGKFPYYLSYSFTPTEIGEMYFIVEDSTLVVSDFYQSDLFCVENSLNDYLLIDYYHDSNEYGLIFNNNISYQKRFKCYFRGMIKNPVLKSEISSYVDSNGNLIALNSINRKGRKLIVSDLTESASQRLFVILSCSDFYVNGISYACENSPTINELTGTNNYSIEVDLFMKDYSYFLDDNVQNAGLTGLFLDNSGNPLEDNSNNNFTIN